MGGKYLPILHEKERRYHFTDKIIPNADADVLMPT
jgi:hypothetical protein